jgi:glutamine synthetase
MIKESKPIIFNGNGYSAEWEKEAARRKLLNLKNTVDALPELVSKEAVRVFETHKVLNEREVHARYEIMLEQYVKTINVEAQLMVLMANRYILPAALEYQTAVAQSVAAGKAAGVVSNETKKLLTDFTRTIDAFRKATDKLADALEHSGGSAEKHAKYMRDTIVPAMVALRELGDRIETIVPSSSWPLPTYREMLFIK